MFSEPDYKSAYWYMNYGTRGGPIHNGEWGGMMHRGNKVYLHIMEWPSDGSPFMLQGFNKKIIGSKGLNVKDPSLKQTGSSVEIDLALGSRAKVDSIIVLETE